MAKKPTMKEWLEKVSRDEPVELDEPPEVTIRSVRDAADPRDLGWQPVIMLDASAAVAVLLNRGSDAPRVRERMDLAGDEGMHVPHLFEVEVMNVLRRHFLSGALSPERARVALNRLFTMRIIRYPHTALLSRVWELKDNVTAYDAVYIALAETLEAPLVTRDARLAQAPGIRAVVEVYE